MFYTSRPCFGINIKLFGAVDGPGVDLLTQKKYYELLVENSLWHVRKVLKGKP